MRLYLRLSKNDKVIPFNYQHLLTGVIHKWIGANNDVHGGNVKFTFSWFQNTSSTSKGINLKRDSYIFISAYDLLLIKTIMSGILKDPSLFNGISVTDVTLQDAPKFKDEAAFFMASPVLLKKKMENNIKHITYLDEDFEIELTNSLKRKLKSVGINSENVSVTLNPQTSYRKTKLIEYNGVKNRTTLAPIIIQGTQEQIEYAWSVGLGNSTGIGFGALK